MFKIIEISCHKFECGTKLIIETSENETLKKYSKDYYDKDKKWVKNKRDGPIYFVDQQGNEISLQDLQFKLVNSASKRYCVIDLMDNMICIKILIYGSNNTSVMHFNLKEIQNDIDS